MYRQLRYRVVQALTRSACDGCPPVFVSEMICIRNNEATSSGLSYWGRADLGDAFEGSSKQFVQWRAEFQILKFNKSVWTCELHCRHVWMETCALLLLSFVQTLRFGT